ncbi:hypothetical protein G4228_015321, partial [Cervus hanglu yarkandensis]
RRKDQSAYSEVKQAMDPKGQRVKLNDGHFIPVLGFGTAESKEFLKSEALEVTKFAIEVGFRHVDSAHLYQNEEQVGQAIRSKIADGTVKREDIFYTSKLWCTFLRPELVRPALEKSLKNLQLDYVDLYIIHFPLAMKPGEEFFPKDENGKLIVDSVDLCHTWEALEKCKDAGLTKSIGVSNFNHKQLEKILNKPGLKYKPVCNQVECHPYLNQSKLLDFCKSHDIVLVAYGALGSQRIKGWVNLNHPVLLEDPVLCAIAKKHKQTPALVVLRYQIQRGVVVLAKSYNKKRIKENIKVFDFELSLDDMKAIDGLNRNIRYYEFLICLKVWLPVTQNKPWALSPDMHTLLTDLNIILKRTKRFIGLIAAIMGIFAIWPTTLLYILKSYKQKSLAYSMLLLDYYQPGDELSPKDENGKLIFDSVDLSHTWECSWDVNFLLFITCKGRRKYQFTYSEEKQAMDPKGQKVKLNDGHFIPVLGFGTYAPPELVRPALEKSLKSLQLDYVDLYIMHYPLALKALEKCKNVGLTKSIGVSNFNHKQLEKILNKPGLKYKPVCNQVECHPYLNQRKLLDFCKSHDIVLVAYSALGSQRVKGWVNLNHPILLKDPVLSAIAPKHKKTPALVALHTRYNVGLWFWPRMFDFELTPEDMKTIDGLNRNIRYNEILL